MEGGQHPAELSDGERSDHPLGRDALELLQAHQAALWERSLRGSLPATLLLRASSVVTGSGFSNQTG